MKILIIEDEKALSESIAAYLKGEDYLCETVADFNSAMEKTELYDYDCILLDISLPGGSGLETLKELKANNKTDGVLIILNFFLRKKKEAAQKALSRNEKTAAKIRFAKIRV